MRRDSYVLRMPFTRPDVNDWVLMKNGYEKVETVTHPTANDGMLSVVMRLSAALEIGQLTVDVEFAQGDDLERL